MSSKPIFLSHAVEDHPIANLIVDELLIGGMGLNPADIFYTSLHETGIRPGADFISTIKEQIQTPTIVLMLISQNYLVKPFCIAEAGACWAMSHVAIPILVPPVKYGDMDGVLQPKQAMKLTSVDDWHAILEEIKRNLKVDPNTNRWVRLLQKFQGAVAPLLENQPKPDRVNRAEHDNILKELEDANEEIDQLDEELEQEKKRSAALSKLKSPVEVAQVNLSVLPQSKQMAVLTRAAKEELSELSRIVKVALFYHTRNERLTWAELGRRGLDDDIEADIKREYLFDLGEEGVALNDDHPRVRPALEALDKLETWMKGSDFELSELSRSYEQEHRTPFSFTNEDFWDRHLYR